MAKIIGNTTATPNPQSNWNQTDSAKADYIKNKPTFGVLASKDKVVKNDLSTDVQTSLNNADSTFESYTESKTFIDALKNLPTADWNYVSAENLGGMLGYCRYRYIGYKLVQVEFNIRQCTISQYDGIRYVAKSLPMPMYQSGVDVMGLTMCETSSTDYNDSFVADGTTTVGVYYSDDASILGCLAIPYYDTSKTLAGIRGSVIYTEY